MIELDDPPRPVDYGRPLRRQWTYEPYPLESVPLELLRELLAMKSDEARAMYEEAMRPALRAA